MTESFDVAAMQASIEALQRVMVRLENEMLELKAATSPEARFAMFKVLENANG